MSRLEDLAEKLSGFKNTAKGNRAEATKFTEQAEMMELAAEGILRLLEDEKVKDEIDDMTNSKPKVEKKDAPKEPS